MTDQPARIDRWADRQPDASTLGAAVGARLTGAEEFLAAFRANLEAALADLDLPAPPPRTRRRRVAAHVGQAFWRAGYTVARAGRILDRAGDRIIDAGDWLAGKVAGR